MYVYKTSGVCSRNICFDLVDGKVKNLTFEGGCSGNLKGIAQLVEGMKAEEVIEKLQGTVCGDKNTSCPDQLSKAIKEALSK
ncbi:uncharacterized protein TIGR03905 [Hathewaya proteolytica DSM 3090]|uniref:ribonucleoside-diphosphate reductase n=1 Tax=Hathewaya proteolytica DSM 3090 TaxID=1121331 RepID=A0A1M6SGC7_9CLOT|nr:TIGR03905 family TSCPD domain-containing protein [Hathewaya proteolytica]SHK43720.1 uncharacterized protein TIGR03905 [Hathewaya proteolytica DSM 3090]